MLECEKKNTIIEIEQLTEKQSKKEKEIQYCINEKEYIDNYFEDKKAVQQYIAGICMCTLVVLLMTIFIYGATGYPVQQIALSVLDLFFVNLTKLETKLFLTTRKKLKTNYTDIANLDRTELEKKKEHAVTMTRTLEKEVAEIASKITTCQNFLSELNEISSQVESNPNNICNNSDLSTNSKQENLELDLKKQIVTAALNDYLSENTQYSAINFDKTLKQPINYTPKSKKLLKSYHNLHD